MKEKQRIFIYDRKEMGVLILLGVMVAVFAFTLGVHLGKRVSGPKITASGTAEPTSLTTAPDKVPDNKELAEQAHNAGQVADDTSNQSLHDEVARTGLKLDANHQVDLPKNPKSENAGATSVKPTPEATPPKHETHAATANGRSKFSLQVGSYHSMAEAQKRAKEIEEAGLSTKVHEAEIRGKGTWYRVFVGEFLTKSEAEKAGAHYREQKLVDSFVVAKSAGAMPE